MQDLIERLEKATGPDREIDWQLWFQTATEAATDWPAYTSSIDAALKLVPDGWSYSIGENEPRTNAQAVLGRSRPTNRSITQEARTPAIALCIAALKARASDA